MAAKVVSIFDDQADAPALDEAVQVLAAGGVVVLPTETVYGAVARLDQPSALARLRELRGSSPQRPWTPHLPDSQAAIRYIDPPDDLARRMMRKLWPGPVALVFDVSPERRRQVAAELSVVETELYDDDTIILRCPDHPVAAAVLKEAGGPAVAIAAGWTAGQTIPPALNEKADVILDAGPTRYSKPSTIVHVRGGRYQIERVGVFDERIIERMLQTTILFVCSGNTCRSPMAEAVARRLLVEKFGGEENLQRQAINVISAGSFAMPGARATPQAVEAIKAMGGDLSRHRSRPLTVELIHSADRIFAMSRGHLESVLALVPSAADKATTLDSEQDIEDPIGGDEALYRSLAGHLQDLIRKRLDEMPLA